MAQPTSHLAPSPWTPSPESGLPLTRSDKEPVEFVATILKIREKSLHGRVVRHGENPFLARTIVTGPLPATMRSGPRPPPLTSMQPTSDTDPDAL